MTWWDWATIAWTLLCQVVVLVGANLSAKARAAKLDERRYLGAWHEGGRAAIDGVTLAFLRAGIRDYDHLLRDVARFHERRYEEVTGERMPGPPSVLDQIIPMASDKVH